MGDMTDEPTKQVSIRLPVSLFERIDAYSRSASRKVGGLEMDRSTVMRFLLERGLERNKKKGASR